MVGKVFEPVQTYLRLAISVSVNNTMLPSDLHMILAAFM